MSGLKDGQQAASDEGEEENNQKCGPSHEEAFIALETALSWYEQQGKSCPTEISLLKRMRDLVAKKKRPQLVVQKNNN